MPPAYTEDKSQTSPSSSSSPRVKTLYEIAEERQKELLEKQRKLYPDSVKQSSRTVASRGGDSVWGGLFLPDRGGGAGDANEALGPFGEAIMYTFTLSVLRFTLDVIVFHQYRQEIVWDEIWSRSVSAVPVLFIATYMMHLRVFSGGAASSASSPSSSTSSSLLSSFSRNFFPLLRQLIFFAIATLTGPYLIKCGNESGYYAVMKQAPPLGTLWIWSVLEMKAGWAGLSVLSTLVWSFWMGYGLF